MNQNIDFLNFKLNKNFVFLSWHLLTGREAFCNLTNSIYDDFPNEKFVGTYAPFGTPFLVIRDLDLAMKVNSYV